MENQKEIWKDVKGYEGLYQVSNLCIVKRISCYVKRKQHIMKIKEKIMIPKDNGKGYFRIKLSKNNISKRVMLHRIIAEAFIDNKNNKPYINHINGIKTDNRIENLEWCNQSENVKHAFNIGLRPTTQKMRETSRKTIYLILEKRYNKKYTHDV